MIRSDCNWKLPPFGADPTDLMLDATKHSSHPWPSYLPSGFAIDFEMSTFAAARPSAFDKRQCES